MTVVNGIEIDNITYNINETKYAIENNDPIEDDLHVIAVVSNPCLYAKRYILMKEFIKRIEEEETNVKLYIVELAYGNNEFYITNKKNKNHLQLRTDTPLWHKENMINLGVKYLLPSNYKAFAWIDADIEFENTNWATDTLKILNGSKDIVQLFSHCVDMSKNCSAMNIFSGFGYNYCKNKKYCSERGINYWHPGYAWAITRKAYEKIGGLFEEGILGSGDYYMAMSILKPMQNAEKIYDKMKKLRLGYVPGVIRHYFHGSKINRKYTDRWKILEKHNYNFNIHIAKDDKGILIPTKEFSDEFKNDIYQYFFERKEDD
jgi:hypothetical protein